MSKENKANTISGIATVLVLFGLSVFLTTAMNCEKKTEKKIPVAVRFITAGGCVLSSAGLFVLKDMKYEKQR